MPSARRPTGKSCVAVTRLAACVFLRQQAAAKPPTGRTHEEPYGTDVEWMLTYLPSHQTCRESATLACSGVNSIPAHRRVREREGRADQHAPPPHDRALPRHFPSSPCPRRRGSRELVATAVPHGRVHGPPCGKTVRAVLTTPVEAWRTRLRPRPVAGAGRATHSPPVTPDLPQPQSLHGPMSLELHIRDGLPAEAEAHLAIEPVRGGYRIVDQCGQERLVSRCAPIHHDKQRDLVVGVQERELPTRPKPEVAPAQRSAVGAGQFFKDVADRGGPASRSSRPAGGRLAVARRCVPSAPMCSARRRPAWAERSADLRSSSLLCHRSTSLVSAAGSGRASWSRCFPISSSSRSRSWVGRCPWVRSSSPSRRRIFLVRILLLDRLRFKSLGRFRVGSDGPTLRPGRGDGNGAADQTDEEVQDAVALS